MGRGGGEGQIDILVGKLKNIFLIIGLWKIDNLRLFPSIKCSVVDLDPH